MPIWKLGTISDPPETVMLDWRVYEVQQAGRKDRTRHFAGSVGLEYEGRTSSAIVSFDTATRTGVSERGRIYKLAGPGSGLGMNANYVWAEWKRKTRAEDVVDVTVETEALLSKKERT